MCLSRASSDEVRHLMSRCSNSCCSKNSPSLALAVDTVMASFDSAVLNLRFSISAVSLAFEYDVSSFDMRSKKSLFSSDNVSLSFLYLINSAFVVSSLFSNSFAFEASDCLSEVTCALVLSNMRDNESTLDSDCCNSSSNLSARDFCSVYLRWNFSDSLAWSEANSSLFWKSASALVSWMRSCSTSDWSILSLTFSFSMLSRSIKLSTTASSRSRAISSIFISFIAQSESYLSCNSLMESFNSSVIASSVSLVAAADCNSFVIWAISVFIREISVMRLPFSDSNLETSNNVVSNSLCCRRKSVDKLSINVREATNSAFVSDCDFSDTSNRCFASSNSTCVARISSCNSSFRRLADS